MKFFVYALWLLLFPIGVITARAEDWSAALAGLPLRTNVVWLTRTNCAEVLFQALPANATVKAIVFLPGATDELYFFRRVNACLTNAAPTLLDAVRALTNQSPLRVVFHAPLLLIHSGEDVLELDIKVEHPATFEKLKSSLLVGRQEFLDRDWKVVRDHHRRKMSAKISPLNRFSVTRHFYRHTYAGWNLTAWESLEATALAGKTRFTIRKNHVEFGLDERIGSVPHLESFPN